MFFIDRKMMVMKKFCALAILLMGMAHAQYHSYHAGSVALDVSDANAAFLVQAFFGADIPFADKYSIGWRTTIGITPIIAAGVFFETKGSADVLYRYHLDKQNTVYGGVGMQVRLINYANADSAFPIGGGIIGGYEYQFQTDIPLSLFVEAGLDLYHAPRYSSSNATYRTVVNPNISIGIKWHHWGSDR